MIWLEIILFAGLFIGIYRYQNSWKPVFPKFYQKEQLFTFGHRGAPYLEHENTLASFTKAIEVGMKGIELDVQYSSDKKLVVFHDWDLEKIIGIKNKIIDLPYSELRKIKLPSGDETDNIPLLEEVLAILPDSCVLNIEIKSNNKFNTGIERQVLEMINKHKIEENCIISSFNPFILRRIKQLNPKILTSLIWSGLVGQFVLNSPLAVWICRPDGFHVNIASLNKKLMEWVRKKNMTLLVYTVNTKPELERALQLKVDGIFTDDPHLN